jgi:predicted transposase/invertase (TIGR01784 family)
MMEIEKDEGYNEGFDKGFDSGYGNGKKENQIEIAKNMFKKNMDIKDISDITNLSIEELTNILNN